MLYTQSMHKKKNLNAINANPGRCLSQNTLITLAVNTVVLSLNLKPDAEKPLLTPTHSQ